MTGTISEQIDRTILFTYLLTVFIKCPGMDIWKKSLLNNQHYFFFANSKSLGQTGKQVFNRDLRVPRLGCVTFFRLRGIKVY